MGSSFEDLVARRLTVETDRNFDSRFRSYDFFYKSKQKEITVRSNFLNTCVHTCLSIAVRCRNMRPSHLDQKLASDGAQSIARLCQIASVHFLAVG